MRKAYRLTAECPHCAAPLILRTNRRTGEPLLGCTEYPHCDFIEPYVSVIQDLATARVAPVQDLQEINRALRRIVGIAHPLTIELLSLRETVQGRATS